MKFTEYKGLDLPKVAGEILEFWEDKKIFEKSIINQEILKLKLHELKKHMKQLDQQIYLEHQIL